VPDRGTLANMAPEYGSTCALFPIDAETLNYLRLTGRDVALVEAYARAQGLWSDERSALPDFDDLIEFDLGEVRPALAGPSRPDELAPLPEVPARFRAALPGLRTASAGSNEPAPPLSDGIVALAAITSCTNTSNPALLIGAGLLARNAVERGLKPKPWVKTSLSPGSRVVTDYLAAAGLQPHLDRLGFHITGFGCGSCLGNSGPLSEAVEEAIEKSGLVAVSVLSGNRNFERRVHPLLRANFLASPPLVVAYALAGTVGLDLESEPLGTDDGGRPVYLRELWPKASEVSDLVARNVRRDLYTRRYGTPFEEAAEWKALDPKGGLIYAWDNNDTVVRRVPFLDWATPSLPPPEDIRAARLLAILGDDISTDFITPAGHIGADSPAGLHLARMGVAPADFSTYSARRGNADLVARSTFAHPRLANAMHPAGGGTTRHWPSGDTMTVFDAGMRYASEGTPTIILAGRNYGLGSARDSAAKGPWLIGVRAVIALSFERIHRSNLLGMGILPLLLPEGTRLSELRLDGSEQLDILGLGGPMRPGGSVELRVSLASGKVRSVNVTLGIETALELDYFRHGGVLPYTLRRLLAETGQRTGARH
jgi:aconitate hydratase